MSWSASVKDELCRVPLSRKCCAVSECYGALLFSNTFSSDRVKLVTEHAGFAERLRELFALAFGISLKIEKNKKYSLETTDTEALQTALGFDKSRSIALRLNLSVLENECCPASLLRGVFLSGGYAADPQRRYHLEITGNRWHVTNELMNLCSELMTAPKRLDRDGSYMLYYKKSSEIEDFLTLIGAPLSAMDVMNAGAEKALRNNAMRRVNCDTANADKTVNAAISQVAAINALISGGKFESLSPELQLTAAARIDNPDSSLNELAALLHIGKSCLAHRLRRLVEM
ncbi:MAG: DNA-binding protein WhiA [Oscillospiraceae bacterium]|jgi:DNA-binding protein WhiA|nr:DNA-binding protein WhiA [Oscillospiraceae bacterium]